MGRRLLSRCQHVAMVCLLMAAGLAAGPLSHPAAAAPSATLVWTRTLGGPVFESSPTVATLDATGPAVMVGARDGKLYALKGSDGSDVAGWPQQTTGGIDSSPSVADTDSDGKPEIFVGAGTSSADPGGALYSFRQDGSVRFRVQAKDDVFSSPGIHSTPALGDVTNQGRVDVSYGSLGIRSQWLASQADGSTERGWPFNTDDTVFSSPALADVNGDGQTDIVVGSDSSPGGPVDWRGGILRALNGAGQELWEFRTDEIVHSSPAIGDIDGDGKPEIVFGTGDYWVRQPGGAQDSNKVFALNMDGSLKWVRSTDGYTSASPALADLDGDGVLDVVIGTMGPGHSVYAWKGNGDPVPGFPRDSGGGAVIGSVTTADIDGDGGQDVFVPTGAGVFVYEGKNPGGGQAPLLLTLGNILNASAFQSSPLITSLDGSGRLDIVIAGQRTDGSGTGVVYRYQMNTPGGPGNLSWPMFHKDPRHTGSWTNPPLVHSLCNSPGGYWLVASDGGIFSFCQAPFFGSTGAIALNKPIVGMTPTPNHGGYWMVASDGGIFAFGNASFHGSTGAIALNKPIVGMTATPSGNGYWLVASDGGIFAFGDAKFHGSTGALSLNKPIVGMTATPSGNGYWLVASDGGIFAFGDAAFHGSTGALSLNKPIVGMTATPSGNGYWMVASDGGIFAFGDASFHGSTGAIALNKPIVGMTSTASGNGYWLVATDGGIFAFGDAIFFGSTGGIKLNQPIVGMATGG